ncbi:WxL domain-containing protein [Carnobacterium divergens]|uniref:WxL domain-containing protein n=1 Tax=Carnobacterium divergens TaxID=2748 RepID=A0AAW8RE44_CARDV|nr:WxL domain-containing protein [Carnobacterium divergens]MDT1959430.1 WxL domain-containing protein [Carnobacterium divergens]MDT1975397.1 WxL domain-containing protein [Carnobacterium divergens]
MKKRTLTAIAGVSLLGLTGLSTNALAAVSSTANSTNHIVFEAGEEVTNPIDPTNPDNPNPSDPIDPTDPTNPGTGNEGSLTIDYVSNIEFGTQKTASGTMIYHAQNEHPFVQVTDKRGTGAGWNLTAKATEFKSATGSKVLKGAELTFKNGVLKTQTENISPAPQNKDVTFSNSDAHVMMNAKEDTGRGTWVDVFSGKLNDNENVQLKVLPGTADTNVDYTATINWELTDAPM